MVRYEEARMFAINALKVAIEKHRAGDWLSIGDELDGFEKLAPEEELEKSSLLFCVLQFWASWASCAEHTWEFEPEVNEVEWPALAALLIEHLNSNTQVTNRKILGICE